MTSVTIDIAAHSPMTVPSCSRFSLRNCPLSVWKRKYRSGPSSVWMWYWFGLGSGCQKPLLPGPPEPAERKVSMSDRWLELWKKGERLEDWVFLTNHIRRQLPQTKTGSRQNSWRLSGGATWVQRGKQYLLYGYPHILYFCVIN